MASDKLELLTELETKSVNLSELYLNPNNPRIMGKKRFESIADKRITEPAIQDSVRKEILAEGINDLIEKIKRHGFLAIDRVVVRALDGKDIKFVILEGNRRITSAKKLFDDHTNGIKTLDDDLLKSLQFIEVLVYNGDDDEIEWILQGMRHINGIKEWGALQQARFLAEMQDKKELTPTELDEMTSLGRNTISNKIRSYHAWQYARDNYHGEVQEDHYSLFNEAVFARPNIKTWLGWDDTTKSFTKDDNFIYLTNWYIGDEDGNRKLDRVVEVRDLLSKLLLDENKSILDKFINDQEFSSNDAKSELDKKHAEKEAKKESLNLDQRINEIDSAITNIKTLPFQDISSANLKDQFLKSLIDLKGTIEFAEKMFNALD